MDDVLQSMIKIDTQKKSIGPNNRQKHILYGVYCFKKS